MAIDVQARLQALSLLERLQDERLSYLELAYEWPHSDDPALDGILRWLWSVCEELNHTPVFDFFCVQRMNTYVNCVVFLSTELEFPMRILSWSQYIHERLVWGMNWNLYCSLPDYPEWPLPLRKNTN